MNERFLYEVKPIRPTAMPSKQKTKKPFVALLTKEEVKEYMQFGAVYRKYTDPNKEMVRVTGLNIDSLHHTMPEDGKPNKPVSDIIPLEKEIVEPVKVELPKEEEDVTKKSNVEESTTPVVNEVSEVKEEDKEVESVETTIEETSTEDIATDEVSIDTPNVVTEANNGDDIEEPASELKEEAISEETISEPTEADEENTSNVETEEAAADDESEVDSSAEQGGENQPKLINNNVQFSSKKKKHHN